MLTYIVTYPSSVRPNHVVKIKIKTVSGVDGS